MSDTTTSAIITAEEERPRHGLGMRLYAVIWWVSFASFTCIMFVWTWFAFLTVLVDRRRRWFHLLTVCFWGWAVYALNPFWSLKVEGREKLPMDGKAVIVPNHDSLADILVCGALFRPFKFVSKKSVFSVPVLGWAMKMAGYIPLIRGNRDSVVAMFDACRRELEDGVPILMFPEGTRSEDGMVRPFKDGAFQLAVDTDSPVYPIILAGTRDALPKHGFVAPLESHVRVRVLDPVYPAEFGHNLERLRDHVRTVIIAEKQREMARLDAEYPHRA